MIKIRVQKKKSIQISTVITESGEIVSMSLNVGWIDEEKNPLKGRTKLEFYLTSWSLLFG